MGRRKTPLGSDADTQIVSEIKAFVQNHSRPSLSAGARPSAEELRAFGYTPSRLFPVASPPEVDRAEADLGFSIPNLLRRMYLEVSNGIEGFSYRISGLKGGCAGSAGTLVEQYRDLRAAFDHLGRSGEWKGPTLPFCDWGCAIYSCVDCADPLHPVWTWENCEVYQEDYTLQDFFRMWVKGNVRRSGNMQIVTKTIKNPFTGREATAHGRRGAKSPK